MKKILLATTVLAASAGVAAADVSFSGSAGFGLIYDGTDTTADYFADMAVAMTGETDGGLAFGADFSITAGASSIGDSVVWIEGGFGKLSVGDVDNAVDASVGGIADVGYSGLGVDNLAETYKGTSAAVALYEGTFGDFSVAVSHDTMADYGIGVGYSFGDFDVAAGYENAGGADGYAVSAGGSFGDFGVNALYASDGTNDSYGLDASYGMGAITVTAAYGNDSVAGDGYGLGVSYDLGGGASVDAGVASIGGTTLADLGINMDF